MKRLACAAIFFVTLLVRAAAEPAQSPSHEPQPFSATLGADEKKRLGLAALSPAQLAELDAAVAAYTRGEKTAAVQQAVQQAEQQAAVKVQEAEKKAATAAVEDYKKKQEPGVIARTLEVFKRKEAEDSREKFTARIVGEFRGWRGGTYFPLTDGHVWHQVGTEIYELAPVQNAEVEIYQSGNGYWRLKYAGAWITVKRVQ